MNYLANILDVSAWLQSLEPETFRRVWLTVGAIGLSIWLFAAYRFVRFALRHRKWRGTWFNPKQYQELVNMLSEDQSSGRRVMQYDEIQLLREWQLGNHYKGLGNDKNNLY
ncbi:MAG: hypothetical protein Q7U32_08780 [Rhodocyclaceae bacterium]|nr:hypothetical protein [Rhodocyclaceae bacterium]